MKYYARTSHINTIEDLDYELLIGVRANLSGRGSMREDTWGPGWIFEADEEFPTYCMIKHGFSVPAITENEYQLLKLAKVIFFSKERTTQLRNAIFASMPLIDK